MPISNNYGYSPSPIICVHKSLATISKFTVPILFVKSSISETKPDE